MSMEFLRLDILYLRYSICLPTWKISVQNKAKPCELPWPVIKTLLLSNYALLGEQHLFKPSIASHYDWTPGWDTGKVKVFLWNVLFWNTTLRAGYLNCSLLCVFSEKLNFVYCSNDAEWIRRGSILLLGALHHMSFITTAF